LVIVTLACNLNVLNYLTSLLKIAEPKMSEGSA